MIEVTMQIDEDELIDIINDKLDRLVGLDSYEIYSSYFTNLLEESSKDYLARIGNIDLWLKEKLSRLEIKHPSSPDYEKWLKLWEDEAYEDKNFVVVEKVDKLLLVEEL